MGCVLLCLQAAFSSNATGSYPSLATGDCRFGNHVADGMSDIDAANVPVSIKIRCQCSCGIR